MVHRRAQQYLYSSIDISDAKRARSLYRTLLQNPALADNTFEIFCGYNESPRKEQQILQAEVLDRLATANLRVLRIRGIDCSEIYLFKNLLTKMNT